MSLITDDVLLFLRALKCGAVEFIPGTGEVRFLGLRYDIRTRAGFRDWSELVNRIGKTKLEIASGEAEKARA